MQAVKKTIPVTPWFRRSIRETVYAHTVCASAPYSRVNLDTPAWVATNFGAQWARLDQYVK